MGTLGAADICCAPHEMSLFGPRNFSLLAVLWPAPQASVLFLSFSPSFFSYMLPAAQKHWAPSLVGRGLRRHVCRATKKIMAGETPQKLPRRTQAKSDTDVGVLCSRPAEGGWGPIRRCMKQRPDFLRRVFKRLHREFRRLNFSKVRQAPRSAIV